MRVIRQAALTLALMALGGCWAQSALADDAAALFDSSKMYVFKLSLPPASRAALEDPAIWQEYQPGKLSWAVSSNGVPPSSGAFSAPEDVEIRLKGNYSFRNLSAKSAFKVKFPKAKPFKGLRVLTLNNMVNDPSMVRETLAYTAFRASGVPAPRTGYAYVYVDGVDYGIHLNIETVDKIALEKLLGPFNEDVQHLYEGEGGADVLPGMEKDFEVDEGDEEDLSDLEELIEAVGSSGPGSWADRVSAVADLEEMTTMWAVEKYIGQWDGYAGQEESWTPNNYYLYSDQDGVFQMLPWGNDESMQEHHRIPFDGAAGVMFDRCLEDAPCTALYRHSVAAVRDVIAGLDLDALAVDTAALLDPWQRKEVKESTRWEWGLEQMEDDLAAVRSFLSSRPGAALEWLGDDLEPEEVPVDSAPPPAAMPKSPEPAGPPVPSLKIGRIWVAGGVLRTQVQLRTGGVVTQRAKISTGKGGIVICRDQAQAEGSRSLVLQCRLPASIRERLRQRPVGLTVATRFFPVGGTPENVARRITLSRG